MVDEDRISARLRRLDAELRFLESVRERGWQHYTSTRETRLATERSLQVALQVCLDVGAHLVAELGLPTPNGYAEVFEVLGRQGLVEADLAGRLGEAARQRNLLVHLYDDVDDRLVFASLDRLEDLRGFARAMLERLEDG